MRERLVDAERPRNEARFGGQAQECEQRDPGASDRFTSGQRLVEAADRLWMPGVGFVDRVEEAAAEGPPAPVRPISSAGVHPIERLRYVARAGATAGGDAALASEAAHALAALGDDHAGLVTACRRILDRHPASGPLWWLAARVLTSSEPTREAGLAARALEADPTASRLAAELPDDVTACILGWPEVAADALGGRPDVRVLVVDVHDELAWRSVGVRTSHDDDEDDPHIVPASALGWAASTADVMLVEASALGSSGVAAVSGTLAAAAVARHAGRPVWAVAGVGRVLAPRLWAAVARRMTAVAQPWDETHEVVPIDLIDVVVGPTGRVDPAAAAAGADCPVAPELLRAVPRLGGAGDEPY